MINSTYTGLKLAREALYGLYKKWQEDPDCEYSEDYPEALSQAINVIDKLMEKH